ncbi:MAG: TRAP transporter small permease [Acetobacteraceae bacterium]
MRAIGRLIGAANTAAVALAAVAVAVMLAAVLQDVARRAVGVAPSLWGLDLARYMLTYAFFLGLGPALASGHHVAVDLFAKLWPAPLRRAMPAVAALLTLGFALVLLWFVWRLAARTLASEALAPTVVPVPLFWIQAVGPVGAALFAVNAAWLAVRAFAERPAAHA